MRELKKMRKCLTGLIFIVLFVFLPSMVLAGWTIEDVDTAGNVGEYASIAVDSNNYVHISYYDRGNGNLKDATNASGSWVTEPVDSVGIYADIYTGTYSSIAVDSNNKVHISYRDITNQNLKYATNASGSWVIQTVDSTRNVEASTSIAVDSNNYVHISYYDLMNYGLNYATNASGSWVIQTVDSDLGTVGAYASMALDSNNKIHISYIRTGGYD